MNRTDEPRDKTLTALLCRRKPKEEPALAMKKLAERLQGVNGKRLLVSLVFVFILSAVTVFAVGAPELFSAPAPAVAGKVCDCACDCTYCITGVCIFKRGG